MNQSNNPVDQFKEIQDIYDTAERFIKEVELCHESVPFPAINQLRYAGHHLLKGLVQDKPQGLNDEFGDVKDHCNRAIYEAADAGLLYLFRLLHKFQTDFKDVPITKVVPNYLTILKLAKDAKAELANGRLERQSPKEHAGRYMGFFRDLKDGIETLETSRDELTKLRLANIRSDKKFVTQIIFMVIGILISATILVSSLN